MKRPVMSRCVAISLVFAILAASWVSVPRIVGAQRLGAGGMDTIQRATSVATSATYNYQGRLTVKGQPANGRYDFKFTLFGNGEGGNTLGWEKMVTNVQVRSGSFTVPLNLDDLSGSGSPYLEIGVRPAGVGTTAFTTLSPRQELSPVASEKVTASATSREIWRLGFTNEGSANYGAVIGRVAADVAAFRSRQAADIYYIFPAPASAKTIQSAHFCVLSRTGAYGGSATLALEIIGFDGTLQHTASAATVDMAAATTDAWTTVTLSNTAGDLQIDPGTFLAFHFKLDGASGGDLDVRPIFEVEVQ